MHANNDHFKSLPTVIERSNYLLLYFYENSKMLGEKLILDSDNELTWIKLSFSQNLQELRYLILEYLFKQKYIKLDNDGHTTNPNSIIKFHLSPKGYEKIHDLKKNIIATNKGFIAMSFSTALNALHESISKAIEKSGYEPCRVDGKEHIDKIDDKIIFDIKQSKFIVADLTEQNNGVYFEAGYALGLDIPIIWTCKESDKNCIHFDIRQYNCLFWKYDELTDLSERLENRIKVTVGIGENG